MASLDLTRFDLNLLVVFDALLAERHVGRAAERLHLSQSATSHALARLRGALADPLFVRHPRGIEPTPLALELGPRVAALLEEIRGIAAPRGPFDPARLQRSFSIGATDYAVLTVLAPALAPLAAAAPGAVWRLSPADPASVVAALDHGELDLVIGSGSFASLPQRIEALPLFDERFVGIARRGHPALRRRGARHRIDLDDFVRAAHVLVSPRGDTVGAVDQALQALGRRRHVAATCPSFLAVPFLVGESDCIAVIAERAAARLADAAGLVIFELPIEMPPWTVFIGRAAGRAGEPALQWLTQGMAAAFVR